MALGRLSYNIVKSIYNALRWYHRNRGVGKAGIVLNYFNIWKELHALTVNISSEGWNSLREMAKQLNIDLSNREDEWIFLYAIETYLQLFSRALALSKLGRLDPDTHRFIDAIRLHRNIFPPSIFEWIYEVCNDQNHPLRMDLIGNLNIMLQILYNLNTVTLTIDVFRELYQNILPKPVRRSLGEFYTREDIIDEVIEAIGLDREAIENLYNRWRRAKESGSDRSPIIIDPACGSGSFLLRVADKIFEVLGCRPDITNFLEDILVGIDINPFAVEIARLNLLVKLIDLMNIVCKAVYTPTQVRIYWGDSLAKVKSNRNVIAQPVTTVSIPTLAPIIGMEEIAIPRLNSFEPTELIDIAYKHVNIGKGRKSFLEYIESREPDASDLRHELIDLYTAVERIHQTGNRKIIELLKTSLAISSLIGMCDYVIGNPPWVRIHRISEEVRKHLRQNYSYIGGDSTYNPRFRVTKTPFREQHDYSIAFVEQGLRFLCEGGILGYVITSKIVKSMYAGAMRRDLLTNYKILELRDYSLHPIPLFQDAVNYPLIISVKKERHNSHNVKIVVVNTSGERRSFSIPQEELPLHKKDLKSPWLLAPIKVIKAYRKILDRSVRLGDIYEVHRGVMTSADNIFIGRIREIDCDRGLALVEFGDGRTRYIELDLLHPFIRGRGVDPFSYEYEEYIVFTHDIESFNPLWDPDQKKILNILGLLTQGIKVYSAGSTVIYTIRTGGSQEAEELVNKLMDMVEALKEEGYNIESVMPCAVKACYGVYKDDREVMRIGFDVQGSLCRVYIEGLRILGRPKATEHFLDVDSLDRLLKRDDYRPNLPPWTIFRTSKEKFRGYRVAWQEIAQHFEACILPVKSYIDICGERQARLLIPDVTVYFISESDKARASKILLYLNSDLARSLLKLRAWNARGGYYRHQSTSVGELPIPKQILECEVWKVVEESIDGVDGEDLNKALEKVYEEYRDDLAKELIEVLGLSEDEYIEIVEWGEWLNETTPDEGEPSEEEVEEPLED